MPPEAIINVSLPPELERFVKERIASGHYQTASEVVREGLQLLAIHESDSDEAFRDLKDKLVRAAAQAERGECVDGEAFFELLRARLRAKGNQSSAA
jgi:antitoxin ParD1/3/4